MDWVLGRADRGGAGWIGRRVLALVAVAVVAVGAAACSSGGDGTSGGGGGTEDRLRDCPMVAWDGNLNSFERQIRERLNDPGSMETFGTYFTNGFALEPDGRLMVRMEWGARNAFGGMVRKESVGYLDLDSCEVEITSWGF